MENTLIVNLEQKIKDLKEREVVNALIQRNVIKEELHYYVLNFIYNHPEYSEWTMYGGSVLRICHNLNRMSIDLDFEISKFPNLKKLKEELIKYFRQDYNIDSSILEVKIKKNRGLKLKFKISEKLKIGLDSPKIHIKIDLNVFCSKNLETEKLPILNKKWPLPFLIKTYTLENLMASKIAAVLGRRKRKRGKKLYGYKAEDIYDLVWYMRQQIVPNLEYLKEKELKFNNYKELFDKLTIKINKVENKHLKDKLLPLFIDQKIINNWLKNWQDFFLSYKKKYEIYEITSIKEIRVEKDFNTKNHFIVLTYATEEKPTVDIIFKLTKEYLKFQKINYPINEKAIKLIPNKEEISDKLKKYISLFFEKTENYLKKTDYVVLGSQIETKLIRRVTAENLNPQKQILLDQSALKSCSLEDLLK